MTKGKLFLVLITLFLMVISASAQQSEEKKFIQFIFSNMEHPDQAKKVETYLRAQEGVFMVRANFNSRKFFIIYYTSSEISLTTIDKWLTSNGLTYSCPREGIHGIDKVIDQKKDCE